MLVQTPPQRSLITTLIFMVPEGDGVSMPSFDAWCIAALMSCCRIRPNTTQNQRPSGFRSSCFHDKLNTYWATLYTLYCTTLDKRVEPIFLGLNRPKEVAFTAFTYVQYVTFIEAANLYSRAAVGFLSPDLLSASRTRQVMWNSDRNVRTKMC